MNLNGKSFLTLLDFTPDEITGLLDLAAALKAADGAPRPALAVMPRSRRPA